MTAQLDVRLLIPEDTEGFPSPFLLKAREKYFPEAERMYQRNGRSSTDNSLFPRPIPQLMFVSTKLLSSPASRIPPPIDDQAMYQTSRYENNHPPKDNYRDRHDQGETEIGGKWHRPLRFWYGDR